MPSILIFDKAKWHEDTEGFWCSLLTKDRAAAAQLAAQVDGPWTAKFSKEKRKRSLDANAYLWVLLDKLSAVLRTPKVELYRELIRGVGGNCETVCVQNEALKRFREGWENNGIGWPTETMPSKVEGCTNVTIYYGSSTYDTAQMGRLLDLVIDECKAQGIETMTPDEIELMKSRWADA